MNKLKQSFAISIATMALASCGGGGTGSSGSVQTPPPGAPTPAPSPAPSPTPSPAGAPTLLTLSQTTQLSGYTASNGYFRLPPLGNVTYAQDLGVGAGFPAIYDAATRALTFFQVVYVIPRSTVAGPTVLTRDNTASDASFSVFRQRSNGVDYTLRQLDIGSSNPTLPLVYSNLAVAGASFVDPADNLLKVGVTPMAFGLPFEYEKASLSGTGAYDGILLGHARGEGSNHVYNVTGTVQFSVNFQTTDFTATIHLTGKDDATGQSVDFGSIDFKPSSPRGVLDFLIALNAKSDSLQARFDGPRAEELIGGVDAHFADPLMPSVTLKLTGAFAAKQR